MRNLDEIKAAYGRWEETDGEEFPPKVTMEELVAIIREEA